MSDQTNNNAVGCGVATAVAIAGLFALAAIVSTAATAIEEAAQARYAPERIAAEGQRAIDYAVADQMAVATLAMKADVYLSSIWPFVVILILIILLVREIKRTQEFNQIAQTLRAIAEAQ